jgi:hypothetical protein
VDVWVPDAKGVGSKKVLSVMMTLALHGQEVINATDFDPTKHTGALRCAGTGCGCPLDIVLPGTRYAYFRIHPLSRGHVVGCDIWSKMKLAAPKLRRRQQRPTCRAAENAKDLHCDLRSGREGRSRNARPDPKLLVDGGHGDPGGADGRGDAAGRLWLRSAAEIEARRRLYEPPNDASPLIDDVTVTVNGEPPRRWLGFYVNCNGGIGIRVLADSIRSGNAPDGVALAATVISKPSDDARFAVCRQRNIRGVEYQLHIRFGNRKAASIVTTGLTYIFAGMNLRCDEHIEGGIVHRTVTIRVAAQKWIALSEAPNDDAVIEMRTKAAPYYAKVTA